MASLVDIISDYSPPNGQTSVPRSSPIVIEFSGLMDEASVTEAFFLEGPDTDTVFGPDSKADIFPSTFNTTLGQEPDFLTSPGYKGIVQGTMTFSESGNKTTMTFTPSQIMAGLTEYTANLTDCYTRSIATTISGTNTGNGEVTFTSTGLDSSDTINLRISESGVAGVAEFEWWLSSDPMTPFGPILSTRREVIALDDGLFVEFGDGDFDTDDEFSAALTPAVLYEGQVTFDFITGTGSITALPSTSSTSVLSTLGQSTATSAEALYVVSTTPSNHSAQIGSDLTEIVIEFNKVIDATSINTALFLITSSVASSHPSLHSVAEGTLAKRITVSGKTLRILI
jgi:hypothetical protein